MSVIRGARRQAAREPTELIEFSPVQEHDKTMSVVMANVFAETAS